MNFPDFERRLNRPTQLKLPELERNGRLKHVLFARQLGRELLEELNVTATMIRHLAATKDGAVFLKGLLPEKRAMLYFTQTSTRTFLSFTAACQLLGMSTAEIRDPSVSSEYKGESPLDSMRMFSSYFDIVVMRSGEPNFAEVCAYLMNDLDAFHQRSVPIINAGAGTDEHPTQSLLDIHTIQRCFEFESERDSGDWNRFDELRKQYRDLTKGLSNKVYGFCGDLARGRTVRSLAILLSQYEALEMHFVAPADERLRLHSDLKRRLLDAGVSVHEHERLDDIVEDIDLLYMTRVQSEHDKAGSETDHLQQSYAITTELANRMKSYAPILHPFPRNSEIPPEIDRNERAMYFHQARNGLWARAALLTHLFDVDRHVTTQYRRQFSEFHNYNRASPT